MTDPKITEDVKPQPHSSQATLRDEFAMHAVAGLMGRAWDSDKNSGEQIIKLWAESAYAVADAMLKERAK
jgi:hypothetical protein